MNKKILFGVAAMGILGMVGAGVGLSNMGPAKETKADDPVSYTVYFDYSELKDAWSNPASIYFRYWNGTKDCWDPCTPTKQDYVVSFTFTDAQINNNGFTFRNSDSGKDDGNELYWISLTSVKDDLDVIFVGHASYSDNGRRNFTPFTGDTLAKNYGSEPFIQYEDKLAPSYNTERVWAAINDGSISSWWTIPPVLRVGVGGQALYYATDAIVNGGVTYYYADIPVAREYMNYIRPISNMIIWWNITNVQEHSIGYIKDRGNGVIETDAGSMPNATAASVAKVLEGYVTCSSSTANGYGSANLIKSNFIDNLAGGQDLSTVNITDYAFHDTKEVYTGADIKNKTVSAQDKWDEMYGKYSASLLGDARAIREINGESNDSLLITSLISIGAIVTIGGLFLLRKKRAE